MWILILLAAVSGQAGSGGLNFLPRQCKEFPIQRGEGGRGILRYCDDGRDQGIYVSGEMDVRESRINRNQDLRSINSVLALVKKRTNGTFEVVTENSGGGDVEWHQKLIMGVEDACLDECRIVTRMKGFCESACAQLHLTCAKHAKTYMLPDSRLCEHASNDDETCRRCDPNPPRDCNICDPAEAVMEYKDRCGKLLRNRKVAVDEAKKRQVEAYVDRLRAAGVFDSDTFVCSDKSPFVRPPWVETEAVGDRTTAPEPRR